MRRILRTLATLPTKLARYIKGMFVELRRMEWLSFGQVVRFTFTVLFVSILLTALILAMDAAFGAARDFLLVRI